MKKTDEELMHAIGQGSGEAFQELFDRYAATVLGYSGRILANRAAAEDVSQDVWLKVVRLATSFRGENFKGWLLTVVRHSSIQILRQQKKWVTVEPEDLEMFADLTVAEMEQILEHCQNHEKVKKCIEELPDQQRISLLLFMTEDLSYEEIANHLDVSISAVKSLIFRAREKLKSQLQGGRS